MIKCSFIFSNMKKKLESMNLGLWDWLIHTGQFNSSCPKSLLRTTLPSPGCPWVPGGPKVTPATSFRCLVLNHQVLNYREVKQLSKAAKFDQEQQILSVILAQASLKLDGGAPNP